MIKLFGDVLSKGIASTSWRDTPATSVIRIRPEEIANRTFMRNFLNSVKCLDLVKSVDGWG